MCDEVYFFQASDLDFMISMGVICPSTSAERGIMAAMPTVKLSGSISTTRGQ